MTLTVDLLQQWFRQFNETYFDGILPMPVLLLSKTRSRLGSIRYRRRRHLFHNDCDNVTIRISTYYESTEHEFQSVLLHEMIHYYIAYKDIHDTSSHGRVFREIMNRLNKDYGWDISVRSARQEKNADTERTYDDSYLVFAAILETGEHILSVVNPRYALILDGQAKKERHIAQHEWYISHSPHFRNFPKVRSLRGVTVSKEEFEEKVSTMEKFVLKMS